MNVTSKGQKVLMKQSEILDYIHKHGRFETFKDPFMDDRVDSELGNSLRALLNAGKIEFADGKRCSGHLSFVPSIKYCRELDERVTNDH